MNPKPTYGYVFTTNNILRGSKKVPLVLGKIYHKRMTVSKEIWFHTHILRALRGVSGTTLCKYQILSPIRVDPYFEDGAYYTDRVKLVAFRDVSRTLHKLSLYIATATLLQCPGKNKLLWDAIEMKWAWLEGRVTDDELKAYWNKMHNDFHEDRCIGIPFKMYLGLSDSINIFHLVDKHEAVRTIQSLIDYSVSYLSEKAADKVVPSEYFHYCFDAIQKVYDRDVDELLTDML